MTATPPYARGVFVAGTDTEVGKTHTTVRLVRALGRCGLRVAAMKPVAAGADRTDRGLRNADAIALAAAANVSADYANINPYCLPLPVSPHIAARDAGIRIETSVIAARFRELAAVSDCVVVEGAGGWLAPISDRESMADVALALGLPVLLVVGLKLGCLNHARLTAAAIEASGLDLAGWVANHIDPHYERLAENLETLERLLGRAPLAYVAHGSPVSGFPEAVASALIERLGAA